MAIYPVQYTKIHFPPSPGFATGRVALRPILRATLRSGLNHLSCYSIVDSGADHCVFPRSFLQPLGLDALAAPIEMTAGVGGTRIPTHFFNIEIDLQGLTQFPVYAGFTIGLEPIGMGLLGQTGFFERFHVHFKLSQEIYEIEVPALDSARTELQ